MSHKIKSFLLFLLVLVSFFFTVLVHLLAYHFYLYWTATWIDTLIHFFGGFTAGISLLWLLFSTKSKFSLKALLLWLLIVGIFWEIYEYQVGFSVYSISFIFDTGSDLLLDLSGGLLAYLLINRSIK